MLPVQNVPFKTHFFTNPLHPAQPMFFDILFCQPARRLLMHAPFACPLPSLILLSLYHPASTCAHMRF